MKFFCSLLILFSGACLAAEEETADFLRFKNGDTLHGNYLGLDEGPILQWQSSEAEAPIPFETNNLRKLVLNNGRAEKPLTDVGLVVLNNGDRLPGKLIAMGGDSVSLQTQFAGLLTIPRNTVRTILPNRHGGDVLYAGPFSDQDWEVPGSRTKAEDEEREPEENGEEDEPKEKEESESEPETEDQKPWVYGGASWMSNSSNILRLETKLPDMVSIRFRLAWQAPLNATIAVFADFKKPHQDDSNARVRRAPDKNDLEEENEEPADEEEDQAEEEKKEEAEKKPLFDDIMEVGPGSHDAESYGSGYLVSVLSSYSRLQRLSFDDKKQGKKTSFPNSGGRLNMGDLYVADFEIRANRTEGSVSLFVNGEFYSEWQDLDEPLEATDRYFAISTAGKSRIRISDVVVSQWNGMPDSARSMKTKARDVLLLANGTDRISGEILTMEEDVFRVESDYGIFQIPAHEVTDIQLASNSIIEPPETTGDEILVSLQPNGVVTLEPQQGLQQNLSGKHAVLGDLTLDLGYAYLLEFDPIGSIFDNWDDEF